MTLCAVRSRAGTRTRHHLNHLRLTRSDLACRNPEACASQGEAVTTCVNSVYGPRRLERRPSAPALTFLRFLHRLSKLAKDCQAEFTKHWTCLDKNNQGPAYCRPEELALAQCALAKLVRRPASFG